MAEMELRAFVFIDRMQPQYAAFVGTTVQGDIPVAGMSQLYVEVAPGNEIYRLADIVLKSSQVKPASLIIEREFGMLEIHALDQAAVATAGDAILNHLGIKINQRKRPEVNSAQIISNVDPYQAQLINKMRKGAMLVPGETLYVMEVSPAAYITVAANEAEKATGLKIVNVSNVGRFGRLFVAGSHSEVEAAKEASIAAIKGIDGQ